MGTAPTMKAAPCVELSLAPLVSHQASIPRNESDERERGLHGEAALIGRLPLSEKGAIIKTQPRRLFSKADIKGSACEQRRGDEGELGCEHRR
jgi:hypothetical protein